MRRHRGTHNQSLGDLSRVTGLSKTSLVRLEAGDGNPSLETLWRLGQALGLTIGQLLEGAGPAPARVLRAGDGPMVESASACAAGCCRPTTGRAGPRSSSSSCPPARASRARPRPRARASSCTASTAP